MLGGDVEGAFFFVDHHAGAAALHVTDVALEGIVYGGGRCAARLAVVGGEAGGLFDSAAGDFTPGSLDDDVGAWHTTGVEPDIVGCCLVKCDLFVLATVLADEYGEAVTAEQAQRYASARRNRFACDWFAFFALPGCFLSFLLL